MSGHFITKFSTLMKFLSAINALTPECRVHIAGGRVGVKTVDFANVGLAVIEMEVSECTGEAVLGIDVSTIKDALQLLEKSLISTDTPVKVSWLQGKDPSQPYLDIEIFNDREYHARFETLNQNSIRKDPERTINPTAVFGCDGAQFYQALLFCSGFSDKCRIEVDNEGVVFLAAKGDIQQTRLKLAIGGSEPALACYSLDYLIDFSKILKETPLTIRLNTDFPCTISGTVVPGLSVMYALAPRITETEDAEEWLS